MALKRNQTGKGKSKKKIVREEEKEGTVSRSPSKGASVKNGGESTEDKEEREEKVNIVEKSHRIYRKKRKHRLSTGEKSGKKGEDRITTANNAQKNVLTKKRKRMIAGENQTHKRFTDIELWSRLD